MQINVWTFDWRFVVLYFVCFWIAIKNTIGFYTVFKLKRAYKFILFFFRIILFFCLWSQCQLPYINCLINKILNVFTDCFTLINAFFFLQQRVTFRFFSIIFVFVMQNSDCMNIKHESIYIHLLLFRFTKSEHIYGQITTTHWVHVYTNDIQITHSHVGDIYNQFVSGNKNDIQIQKLCHCIGRSLLPKIWLQDIGYLLHTTIRSGLRKNENGI